MPDQADRLRYLAALNRRSDDEGVGRPSLPSPGARTGDRAPDNGEAAVAVSVPLSATPTARVLIPGTRSPVRAPGLGKDVRTTPVGLAPARTIAVTSGKGGVGKTCLTVNLGIALADRGYRVVVVDLDLGLANVDVVTDVRSRYNLYHVLVGRKDLRDILVPGPGGILIVPGASGISQLADLADGRRRDLIARLAELEGLADFILIDTAAGIGRNVIGFAQAADEVLVVTTPEPTAVTDAYAVIKTICRAEEHGELNLVVNMAANAVQARRVARRITSVAKQFLSVYIEEAGYVVTDDHVREAVARRQPFMSAFPKSPASACIAGVAEVMSRGVPRPSRPGGFFARLAHVLTGRVARRAVS